MSELLESRYGRGKAKRRDRALAFGIGGGLLALFLTWMISVTFFAPPKATGEVTGFQALSNTEALVKGTITKPAGTSAVCGIGANNGLLSTVGFVEQTFSGTQTTIAFEVKLKTTELAGSGVVTECRLK